MLGYIKRFHAYVETIPERLYPIATEIEGRVVRGRQSYLCALESAYAKYGPNRFSYTLLAYRAAFHLVGSVLFLICAAAIAHRLFGSDIALYVIVGVAIALLTMQEFYLHPRRYGQLRGKGVADWLTWVLPIMIYFSL